MKVSGGRIKNMATGPYSMEIEVKRSTLESGKEVKWLVVYICYFFCMTNKEMIAFHSQTSLFFCQHGIGTYYYHTIGRDGKLEEGGKFCGDFKENSRHGIGKYSLTDGSTYDGEWRDNVPCGKGLFYWPDGSTYDGHWKDGKRHGMGKLDSADGFMYDGMWIYNAMEGKGSAVYPNGQQYDGNWLNGKRDGRGTIVFGNGAVYKGRFKEDCLEGQGTLKLDHNVAVSRAEPEDTGDEIEDSEAKKSENNATPASVEEKDDWMIPIEFQSDIGHIHQKAGFTAGGE